MTTVYRSTDAPPGEWVDFWRHASRKTFGPASLRPGGVPSRLRVADLGAVRVADMTVSRFADPSPCLGVRSSGLVRRAGREQYRVSLVLRGQMVVEQDGRESRLGPGEFAIDDMSRPQRWAAAAERFVVLIFPRALLPVRPDDVARLTAVGLPGDRGTAALFTSLARQLAGQLDDYGAVDGTRVGTALLDLLSATLSARLDDGRLAPTDARQRVLLMRIHAFIEERLADPELSPATIAAAHHVSVRYLYKLFETQGESVAGWIRRRRLERCRRDLLDPATQHLPVSATAARHGLTNAAHFSRSFKRAYGLSPVEYRALRGAADTSVRRQSERRPSVPRPPVRRTVSRSAGSPRPRRS